MSDVTSPILESAPSERKRIRWDSPPTPTTLLLRTPQAIPSLLPWHTPDEKSSTKTSRTISSVVSWRTPDEKSSTETPRTISSVVSWRTPDEKSSMKTPRTIRSVVSWRTPDEKTPCAFRTPRKELFSPSESLFSPSSPMPMPESCRSPWNSPYSPWRSSVTGSPPTGLRMVQEPVIRGTQLMGDSMLMRFTKVITGIEPTCDAQRCVRIGLCVSGQNLAQLCWRLRHQLKTQPELELAENVLLMCGTNDILQNTELSRMKSKIYEITRILLNQKRAVTVLTIPPIPKCTTTDDVQKIIEYNHYLITSLDDQDVRVVDILPLFMLNGMVRFELFEESMGSGKFLRPDLIHWNRPGIEILNAFLTRNGIL